MVSGATNVSASQAHMLGMNHPSSGIVHNLADPFGSSNVKYQQPYEAQVQYQTPYVPYGSQGMVNQPYTLQSG